MTTLAGATAMDGRSFDRPYVISWNLTYRCNLACEHCYLDAGAKTKLADDAAFADRSELSTEECYKVVDDIASFAPESVTILTGGEPLLRRDILDIVRYAHAKELWVVVGTNGVKITANLAEILKESGVRGLALSLDALDPDRHDGFRRVRGAWANTVEGAKILHRAELPFIVQTTVGKHNLGELPDIARFAHDELGASVWNVYFLVPTGRGEFVSDVSAEEYDGVLATLYGLQREYRDRMLVNAKCAPHYIRTLFEREPESPFTKTYTGGAGGCPAGTHYMGIRPNGDVTPCPYLPAFGGSLRKERLAAIWNGSELFTKIRERNALGGRCGDCEFSTTCGGCRARAFGATGDLLAEDPLCTHTPGTFVVKPESVPATSLEYGASTSAMPSGVAATSGADGESVDANLATPVAWEPEARERMKRIPMFVRGMVSRRVEQYCRERSIETVTPEVLDEIRSRMPTPKVFGRS